MNFVHSRMRHSLRRDPVGVPAIPNVLAGVWPAHWNGSATQLNDEHRPFILVQPAELRHFIIREKTCGKALASDGSGGQGESLPGVPDVV
jgi:hypothetical protein